MEYDMDFEEEEASCADLVLEQGSLFALPSIAKKSNNQSERKTGMKKPSSFQLKSNQSLFAPIMNSVEKPNPVIASKNVEEDERVELPDIMGKNRNFILQLQEKKKLAAEKEAKEERRKLKMKKRLSEKVRLRALEVKETEMKQASLQANQELEPVVLSEEELERKKYKALQAKRLREKQRKVLEDLERKKQQKKEKKQEKLQKQKALKIKVRENMMKDMAIVSKVQNVEKTTSSDANVVSAIQRKKSDAEPVKQEPTAEEKEIMKQKMAAIREKQREHFQKIAGARKEQLLLEAKNAERKKQKKERVRELAKEKQEIAKEKYDKVQKERIEKEQSDAAIALEAQEAKPKVNVEAMVSRLTRMSERDTNAVPEAKDFASWKKRNDVPQDARVFSITGWYPVIKEQLEARGWYFNPDRESPFFDMKWTLKSDDLKSMKLKPDQFVNHFMQNTAITTKSGLLHNLRSLKWFQNVDINTIFPRCYDLNDVVDMQIFQEDFKSVHAESILKNLVVRAHEKLDNPQDGADTIIPLYLNAGVFETVQSVCLKQIHRLTDESLDEKHALGIEDTISDLEWEVLLKCDIYSNRATIGSEEPNLRVEASSDLPGSEIRKLKRDERIRHAEALRNRTLMKERIKIFHPFSATDAEMVIQLEKDLRKTSAQYDLNGKKSKNVWIVKPAGMSRGRGIRVFDDLNNLLQYTDVENHKESQWIVQKYMENPLLIGNRKFDIRQWVLVTSWNPITIWFYNDCYLRFCVEEFSLEDLNDQYIHLANNSISKFSDKFDQVYNTKAGSFKVEGNMWHSDDFKEHLQRVHGSAEIWEDVIQKRMKDIVSWSLQCVQDTVKQRKNACELYGYDFMIDENNQPWLIEVNSSPACDYSTKVAQRYVEEGLSGIVQVIVDHRDYERQSRGSMKNMDPPCTGRWSKIHQGEFIQMPVSSLGADFEVKGNKLSRKGSMRMSSRLLGSRKASAANVEENIEPADTTPQVHDSECTDSETSMESDDEESVDSFVDGQDSISALTNTHEEKMENNCGTEESDTSQDAVPEVDNTAQDAVPEVDDASQDAAPEMDNTSQDTVLEIDDTLVLNSRLDTRLDEACFDPDPLL